MLSEHVFLRTSVVKGPTVHRQWVGSVNWSECLNRCRLEALRDSSVECGGGARPSVSVLQLRLLCCFAAGALMASWTWTPAAASAWRRYAARYHVLVRLYYRATRPRPQLFALSDICHKIDWDSDNTCRSLIIWPQHILASSCNCFI